MAEILKGGEFLIKETSPQDVFIPEEFNEEQRMMSDMAHDFLETEVLPNLDRLDAQEEGLMSSILDKAGELGLLGTSIPEEYGGFGKDFITNMKLTEVLGAGHSFSVAMAAHTGIGTLPILYFGTEEQKKKYLPKLLSGEWKSSYCLTEPGSGSDALAAKTKATIDGDNYVINGQKMWITNAGFAHVFIVFAQLENSGFTAFIVERDNPGISFGEEEHKMGIKGSSTRQVFFNDCKIPKTNLLGETGRGHVIAFNILNIGRIKLAGAVLGGAKRTVTLSVQYANQREQFKQKISEFGAIKYKLAEQAIRTYALESAVYRTSDLIERKKNSLISEGKDFGAALLGAAETYAIECAILKVLGSEVLDYIVDEGVQIYGGMGYSAEAPMDRAYRDSRINRIFEGTNEINRLLTVDMLMKRALKGELDLMGPAQKIQGELMAIPEMTSGQGADFEEELEAIAGMKKAVLMVAGSAVQKYMQKLADEQEIIMNLADMIIETFTAESLVLRVAKLAGMDGGNIAEQKDMMNVYLYDARDKVNIYAKNAINSFAGGDESRMLMLGLKRFTKQTPFNAKEARRRIADRLILEDKYPF
jgi:alkylation response protein AidB-like acyl-CoA dehydrogenase